jgi:tetratricopeptide (TPR) repeat protein
VARNKRKHKGHAVAEYRQLAAERLGEELSALLEAGKHRQAVELSKEIRRRQLIDGHRELIERAYRGRAAELAEKKLFRESLVMVENALDCRVSSPALAGLAARVALAGGEVALGRDTIRRMPLEPGLAASLLADLAVLAPSGPAAPGSAAPAELGEPLASEVACVLRAFGLYEEGRDAEAKAELGAIGRSSQLARWRLLLRGLIARAQGDPKLAAECWERIEPFGPCGLLARSLLEDPRSVPAPDVTDPVALGGACSRLLAAVRDAAAELGGHDPGGTKEAQRRLILAVDEVKRSWPKGLSPAERERLFRAIEEKGLLYPETAEALAARLGRLPEDPWGTRRTALALEAQAPSLAHEGWLRTIESLPEVAAIPPEQRPVAEALIWERCGELAERCASRSVHCFCPKCRRRTRHSGGYVDTVQPGAAACYRKAMELDPATVSAPKKLLAHLRACGRAREAREAAEQLLARAPEDVETILLLAESAYARGAYRKAQSWFRRAQALEPLDARIIERLADCAAGSALRLAQKGRFRRARKALEAAGVLRNGNRSGAHWTIAAAVELSSGDAAAAEACLERAALAGEWPPAAAWRLVALLERWGAPAELVEERIRAVRDLFSRLELDPPSAERAAQLYARRREKELSWSGASHVASLLRACLREARRLSFSEVQRLELCELFRSSGDLLLTASYARAGIRQFPRAYRFALLEAEALVRHGKPRLGERRLEGLRRALELACEAGDRESALRIEVILRAQELIESEAERLPALSGRTAAGSR